MKEGDSVTVILIFQVREKFQNMMKDMNIFNETVMLNTPIDKMRIMLENNYKVCVCVGVCVVAGGGWKDE